MRRWAAALVFAFACQLAAVPAGRAGDSLHFDDLNGLVIVPVQIDGRGPYHFVLDTGAGTTVVTPELASSLDLETSGSRDVGGMGETRTAAASATLGSVRVGSALAQHVDAIVLALPLDLTYQGRFGSIDGILGKSFYAQFVTTIDYAAGTVSFDDPRSYVPDPAAASQPLAFGPDGLPSTLATIDGARGYWEIDTGNDGWTIVSRAFAREHDIRTGPTSVQMRSLGVGGESTSQLARIERFGVGASTLYDLLGRFSGTTASAMDRSGYAGNLGYDLLNRFAVSIDAPHKTLYLKPNAQLQVVRAYASIGVAVRRTAQGAFAITNVEQNSSAGAAGVQPGDLLVSIDDVPTSRMSLADYARSAQRMGATARYEFRRNGTDYWVQLTSTKLL